MPDAEAGPDVADSEDLTDLADLTAPPSGLGAASREVEIAITGRCNLGCWYFFLGLLHDGTLTQYNMLPSGQLNVRDQQLCYRLFLEERPA